MSKPPNGVIAGVRLADFKTGEALRKGGFDGSVTVTATDSHPTCENPPLPKSYLPGTDPFGKAIVKPQS